MAELAVARGHHVTLFNRGRREKYVGSTDGVEHLYGNRDPNLFAQTKVVEAVPDPGGCCVPMTPTISVEPLGGAVDVWHLTAALSSPSVAAAAVLELLGTGRSSGILRWSARGVLAAPLPTDRDAWDRGADLVRRIWEVDGDVGVGGGGPSHHELLDRLGAVMAAAHGLAPDDPVVAWWSQRRPRR
jgi:hypothetical protein